MKRARFITFEGGEGVGKSTQAERLAARLRARGLDCLVTREPGGSPFAERVRDLLLDDAAAVRAPLAEALLFYAARADHLAATIRPALAKGTWVLCDRFADSTRAYQGAASGVDRELLSRLERMVIGPTRPDLTLVLDLDPTVGLARATARHAASVAGASGAGKRAHREAFVRDAFESKSRAFHERLRKAFLEIAEAEPQRCAVVAADAAVDDIEAEIWTHVMERLRPVGLLKA
jgi:dTMP kinase